MSNVYDINNLNDEQIYNILGVNPDIEDHLLEILIKTKIDEYKKKDEELSLFFQNIYDYFFLEEIHSNTLTKPEGFENNKQETSPEKTEQQQTTQQQTTQQQTTPATLQQIVQYKSDILNPLLKETITKTLTINSFDRDNKKDDSSNFSLTLSESLNNIVSLNL